MFKVHYGHFLGFKDIPIIFESFGVILVIFVYLRVFRNFRDFMSIFVIYILRLLGNLVGLVWVDYDHVYVGTA